MTRFLDPWFPQMPLEEEALPVGTVRVYGGHTYQKVTTGKGRRNWLYLAAGARGAADQAPPKVKTPELDPVKTKAVEALPGFLKMVWAQKGMELDPSALRVKFNVGTSTEAIHAALQSVGVKVSKTETDSLGRPVAVIAATELLAKVAPPPAVPPKVEGPPKPAAPLAALLAKVAALPGYEKCSAGRTASGDVDPSVVLVKFTPKIAAGNVEANLKALGITPVKMVTDAAGRPTAVVPAAIWQKAVGAPTPQSPAKPLPFLAPSVTPASTTVTTPTSPTVAPKKVSPKAVGTLQEAFQFPSEKGLHAATKDTLASMKQATKLVAPLGLPKGVKVLPVPFVASKSLTALGYYKFQVTGPPVSLSTKVGKPTEIATTVHEIGHYLDHQVLGPRSPGHTFGAMHRDTPEAAALKEALYASEGYKSISGHQDAKFRAYLRQPCEVFARAFAQYILTQNEDTNVDCAEELQYLRPPDTIPTTMPRAQWTKKDFEPIAAAMATFLKSEGFYETPETT